MEGNDQINDVVYKYDLTITLPKKFILDLEMESGRNVFINLNYHLSARNILLRRHIQVSCGF